MPTQIMSRSSYCIFQGKKNSSDSITPKEFGAFITDSFEFLSSNSGGGWFCHPLVFSPVFNDILIEMALRVRNAKDARGHLGKGTAGAGQTEFDVAALAAMREVLCVSTNDENASPSAFYTDFLKKSVENVQEYNTRVAKLKWPAKKWETNGSVMVRIAQGIIISR